MFDYPTEKLGTGGGVFMLEDLATQMSEEYKENKGIIVWSGANGNRTKVTKGTATTRLCTMVMTDIKEPRKRQGEDIIAE